MVGIARRTEKLEKLKEELGSNFLPITCDVSKSENIKNSSDFLKKQNIIPNLFFLNAGCGEIEDKFHTTFIEKHLKPIILALSTGLKNGFIIIPWQLLRLYLLLLLCMQHHMLLHTVPAKQH